MEELTGANASMDGSVKVKSAEVGIEKFCSISVSNKSRMDGLLIIHVPEAYICHMFSTWPSTAHVSFTVLHLI